jgi:hypothetical protein
VKHLRFFVSLVLCSVFISGCAMEDGASDDIDTMESAVLPLAEAEDLPPEAGDLVTPQVTDVPATPPKCNLTRDWYFPYYSAPVGNPTRTQVGYVGCTCGIRYSGGQTTAYTDYWEAPACTM